MGDARAAPALTLDAALREGARRLTKSATPLLDARVLLQSATGFDQAALIAEGRTVLEPARQEFFFGLIDRRADGEPVAYITGEKEFWSLSFKVTPDVLVPRDDSEALIEAVIERRERAAPLRILDLGVGSGCLLTALLKAFPNAFGVGVDRSEAALRVAVENLAGHGLSERSALIAGDWLSAVKGPFDVIVANPPYIPDGDHASLPRDVSAFEPAGALFAGPQGFDSYRKILASAPAALAHGGLFAVEAGDRQAEPLARLAASAFTGGRVGVVNDLKARARVIVVDLAAEINH